MSPDVIIILVALTIITMTIIASSAYEEVKLPDVECKKCGRKPVYAHLKPPTDEDLEYFNDPKDGQRRRASWEWNMLCREHSRVCKHCGYKWTDEVDPYPPGHPSSWDWD